MSKPKIISTRESVADHFGVSVRMVGKWKSSHPDFPQLPAKSTVLDAWHLKAIGDKTQARKPPARVPAQPGQLSLNDQKRMREIAYLDSKIKEKEGRYVDREVHARAIVGTVEMVREWLRDWHSMVLSECPNEMVSYVDAMLKNAAISLCESMRSYIGPRIAESVTPNFDSRVSRKSRAVSRRHARNV